MGLIIKLFKNTSYLAIGSQIGNLLQFLFFIYFARQFGETAVGKYSFAFSFTYIMFLVLADLGLSVYIIREVARDNSDNRQIFARCLILRIIFLSIFSSLTVVIVLLFSRNFSQDTIWIILLLGLYHIFFSITDVFLAEFKGHDRMGLVALLNIFVRFVIAAVGIVLIKMGFDFLTVLVCFPIGSFLYLIVCAIISFRSFRGIKLELNKLNLIKLFVEILPFAFTIVLIEVFYHLDILILRFLKDDQTVGIYSAANKIVLAILGIMLFVHTALLPTCSRLFVDSVSRLIDISKRSLRYLLLIGLPISVGLYGVADKLIILLYSDGFRLSAGVLEILSWTIAIGFATTTYSVLLTAIDRQTQKVIVLGICFFLNLILNFIFIPRWGYNGAAVAKLLSEGMHFVLVVFMISKYFTKISFHKVIVKPAISCVIMYITIRLLDQSSLIIVIPTSVFVYVLSLAVLRGFSHEESEFTIRFFKEMLLKNKLIKSCVSKR